MLLHVADSLRARQGSEHDHAPRRGCEQCQQLVYTVPLPYDCCVGDNGSDWHTALPGGNVLYIVIDQWFLPLAHYHVIMGQW